MPDLHVSAHAVERYIERVCPNASAEQAKDALTSPTITKAARFGAHYVKLGTGQHVVIEDQTIITVLPRGHWVGTFDRRNDR